MTEAYINAIATAVPPHDVHRAFLEFGHSLLSGNERGATLFGRMAERAGIEHRYSHLDVSPDPSPNSPSAYEFYARGNFPSTAARMRLFEMHAPDLGAIAVES